jgi:hypothetical protein
MSLVNGSPRRPANSTTMVGTRNAKGVITVMGYGAVGSTSIGEFLLHTF